jgi:beta-barrel assembly-enhancing protease
MLFQRRATVQPIALLFLLGAATLGGACAPRVTTQQEVQIGQDLAQEINRELPIVGEPAIVEYINQLGTSIALNADPRDIPYTFYVANTEEVNAFSVPGGHVYVYRGLIDRTENLSELAGVLAHEIAHVVERHAIDQWRRAQQAQLGLAVLFGVLLGRAPAPLEGVAIDLGAAGVFAGYSRDAEREADQEAIGYLVDSGIHPIGLVTLFEKLLAERERQPGALMQLFATHPITEERIQTTRAAIEALPPQALEGLARDSEAYQRFRRQVGRLPPPPD